MVPADRGAAGARQDRRDDHHAPFPSSQPATTSLTGQLIVHGHCAEVSACYVRAMLTRALVSLSLALAFSGVAFSCGPGSASTDEGADQAATPSSLSGPEVRLAYAFSAKCPPVAGCTLGEQLDGVVEVKNLSYAKQVEVIFKDANGAWQHAPARYLAPAADGYEAWDFHLALATEFALAYTVNGHTSWDNNHGANYRVSPYGTDALVNGRLVAGINGTAQPGLASGWVFVVNAAYSKSLNVTYTDDAWRTQHVVAAHYASTFPSGVEAWHFEAPLRATAALNDVQLATQFTIGGVTGWDNDYARNYRVVNGALVR
jgi:hypothetical protein